MNKKCNKREKGITLIALIVSIIILIILAAVTIKSIIGEKSIVDQTTEATKKYATEQNREYLTTLCDSITLEYIANREKLTLSKLVEEMSKSVEIIYMEATDSSDENSIINMGGYIYQLYYDENTRKREIEYLGRNKLEVFPEMKTSYDSATATINVLVNKKKQKIEKIELILGEKIVSTEIGENVTFTVERPGTYEIKITTETGEMRYSWIKIESVLKAPIIVPDGIKGSNGWYKEVDVVISGTEETTKIIYSIDNEEEQTVVGDSVRVPINNDGKDINILAYLTDGKDYSDTTELKINKDNTPPQISSVVVLDKTPNTIEVNVESDDETSKINSYEFNIKKSNSETDYTKGVTKNSEDTSYNYIYEGLTYSTNYDLKITVTDKAGNTATYETTTPVRTENAEVSINNKYYVSIQDAIDVVPTDNTETKITLLEDISESLEITAGKNMVLDLNNHTITGTSDNPAIKVDENAKLKIATKGSILSSTQDVMAVYGTLEISGNTIVTGSGEDHATVFIAATRKFKYDRRKVNIRKGNCNY